MLTQVALELTSGRDMTRAGYGIFSSQPHLPRLAGEPKPLFSLLVLFPFLFSIQTYQMKLPT